MRISPTFEETKRLLMENARLSAIIYSIVKHRGQDWNLELRDAADDELPDKILIGYNVVGSDAIVTIAFGSALERILIQKGGENESQKAT